MPAAESLASPTLAELVPMLRAAGCVFAEDEAQLLLAEASSPFELFEWLERRVSGEPLEYIVGWAEFCGLRITVDPGVFVPRRRTELLVSEAALLLRDSLTPSGPSASAIIVDLCCGSGAVGVGVVSQASVRELHSADIDSAAVECARRNLSPLGGYVHQGDLYGALPARLKRQAQLIVANAPYVPTSLLPTMPPEARSYEQQISLNGGPDGLDLHRRVIEEATEWLDPAGHLVIETSEHQAAGTAAIMGAAGLGARTVHSDDLDGTVVVGTPRA